MKNMSGNRETGCSLRDHMNGHRSSINNGGDTPVAVPFSQSCHHMGVMVLQQAPSGVIQRRLVEKDWIARFARQDTFVVVNRDDGLDILVL